MGRREGRRGERLDVGGLPFQFPHARYQTELSQLFLIGAGKTGRSVPARVTATANYRNLPIRNLGSSSGFGRSDRRASIEAAMQIYEFEFERLAQARKTRGTR